MNKKTVEVLNAIIRSIFIGIEGHGIPTSWIELKMSIGCQAFGCYETTSHPLFIHKVLNILEIEDISNIIGKSCRVRREDDTIIAIGHIVEEKWYCPREDKNKDKL